MSKAGQRLIAAAKAAQRERVEHTYTLSEVTEAAGVAFARAKNEPNAERAAEIYSDVLIKELKK